MHFDALLDIRANFGSVELTTPEIPLHTDDNALCLSIQNFA